MGTGDGLQLHEVTRSPSCWCSLSALPMLDFTPPLKRLSLSHAAVWLTLATFPMCADWIALVVLFATSALIFSKLVRHVVRTGRDRGRTEEIVLGRQGSGLVSRVKGLGRDRRYFSFQDS
jgi:membrane protein implicated in regulation of membrane protease activity